ncbi:unnamed protein product [Caenorhabditis sp. 36 PRJEB53466]|nr:unnamed protein product [Caenorhabditis sp. 36 PRJEB53466]
MQAVSVFVPFPTVIVTLVCRLLILRVLNKFYISSHSKQIQRSIANVLLVQALAPIWTSLSSFLYLATMVVDGGSCPLCENLPLLPLVFFTVVNSVCTLLFIPPYRKVVHMWFNYKQGPTKVIPTITVQAFF